MNKEQSLKANIAAAKMLGHSITLGDRGEAIFIPIKLLGVDTTTEFDIFTNPADCLAVVKKLLSVYVHTIQYNVLDERYYYEDSRGSASGCAYETYEEAVAAAVMEVTK